MAVRGMGVAETALVRIDHSAFRHDLRAAGMEMAAGRRIGRGRQVPLKPDHLPFGFWIDRRYGRQERPGIGMFWMV